MAIARETLRPLAVRSDAPVGAVTLPTPNSSRSWCVQPDRVRAADQDDRRLRDTPRRVARPADCSFLLARSLQRVGQLRDGLGYCGIRVHHVAEVVARAGLVEPVHCRVEVGPEVGWAAAAGPWSLFVGWARSFGVCDGPPRQSCVERSRVSVAHRGRRVRERSQSSAKAGIGRCLLAGAQRAAPRSSGVVD